MAREFTRADRVAGQMKREIAVIMQREMKDPRVRMVTVSDVSISGDLMYAKVYVTMMEDKPEAVVEAVKVLNKAKGFFRSKIGKVMKLRVVPEIAFYFDKSLQNGMRLNTLINQAVRHDKELREEETPEVEEKDAAS